MLLLQYRACTVDFVCVCVCVFVCVCVLLSQRGTSTTRRCLRALARLCGRWRRSTWASFSGIPAPCPTSARTSSNCGTTRMSPPGAPLIPSSASSRGEVKCIRVSWPCINTSCNISSRPGVHSQYWMVITLLVLPPLRNWNRARVLA